MISADFVKRYPNQQLAATAIAHRDWLASLESGVRLPALRPAATRAGTNCGTVAVSAHVMHCHATHDNAHIEQPPSSASQEH